MNVFMGFAIAKCASAKRSANARNFQFMCDDTQCILRSS